MVCQFDDDLVESLAGSRRCRGLFLPQFQQIVVILQFLLEMEEFLVRKNHKFLAAVLLDDLRMKCHGLSAISFTAMKYTVHDNPVPYDLKEGSPIAGSHAVLRREM
jgi:hypothetical protein